MKLLRDFYLQDATIVAPLLLGKILCRKIRNEIISLRITETECYMPNDTACHGVAKSSSIHRLPVHRKTQRNAAMFEQGGISYIYLCYGIHNLLNIVTGEKDSPQAVLIRGIEGYDGPGKLTKALQIDRSLNAINLSGDELYLEDDGVQFEYIKKPRVGIDYADEIDRNRLWRFIAIF